MTEYWLLVKCSNEHQTTTRIVRPEFNDEGQIISGYLGSGADFCDVCDEPIVAELGYEKR